MAKDVIRAFLGEETDFQGLLSFEGAVRIDGHFDGEITSEDNLIIGENAMVKARINVGTVMVQGKVEGDIHAAKKLHITSKGRVVGNVDTTALHIEEGAVLDGKVTMIPSDDGANVTPLIRKQEEKNDPVIKQNRGKGFPAPGA